jgi:regulator of sigma E protease
MLTIVAFIVALGLLIAVHEYGHYRVAVACGVKVIRFSIGFGKPLLTWKPKKQHPGQDTEFVIALFPLGGYVRMVDEREGPVPPELKPVAFNNQSLAKRTAIVAAGPIANLLLAIVLYAAVNWIGQQEPEPIVAQPPVGSIAEQAGLRAKDRVVSVTGSNNEAVTVRGMEDVRWLVTQAALDGEDLTLEVQGEAGGTRRVSLPLSSMDVREADAQLLRKVGIGLPWTRAVMGEIQPGSPAEKAGLREGDAVLSIDDKPMADGGQLRETIRRSVEDGRVIPRTWRIERDGQQQSLRVEVEVVKQGQDFVGRIGAYVGAAPSMMRVSYGAVEGVTRAVQKTWEVSALTLRMMGRMLIGEASLKNLSGPLTIADVAGKSASMGLIQYLIFLALISVSLGVLNLLPLPMLDGGHLMYYLWEAVTGRPVSDAWLDRLQRGGVVVLMAMMAVALFNDVTRIFG